MATQRSILAAAVVVTKTVAALGNRVYDGVPEAAPVEADLPCAIVASKPSRGVASPGWVDLYHRIDVEILGGRLADLQAEAAALQPIVDAVIAAWFANIDLDLPGQDVMLLPEFELDASPVHYAQWNATYAGARLGWTVQEQRNIVPAP